MSEKEKLQLENECLMKYSKAQMIQKYIDELEENSKLSELWCKSQQENKKYKEVIDKAIEYLENNSLYEEEYDYDYEENSYLSGIDDETAKKDLLKILNEVK